MKLHELTKQTHRAKRVGRGIAAGQGKTAGRGTKGQKARTGRGAPVGFEGGQTRLYRRLPKRRGQRSIRPETATITLSMVAKAFPKGGRIDHAALVRAGLAASRERSRIVASGTIDVPVRFAADVKVTEGVKRQTKQA